MVRKGFQASPGLFIPEEAFEENFIRSAGPGGQNVNKVSSAVQLRFNPAAVDDLSVEARQRLLKLAGSRSTRDGHIVIEASRFRTQDSNRRDARERLMTLLRAAIEPPPPPRRKTRPTRASVQRRLKAKSGRSTLKQTRSRVDPE